MMKKNFQFLLIFILLFLSGCGLQAPTTIVMEENQLRKGMTRKDMSKIFRFKMLAAHNPFKGECFHEYYPQKKKEIISGNAHILTEIKSNIEPIFYILDNVTIPSHRARLSGNECSHGNGTLAAWVKGHFEALDYVSNN